MFTLYATPLSANGRKVLAVCRHLGLAPELKIVNVYEGEGRAPGYLAINPLGKIPALVDGALVLSESNAILQYVSEAYGNHQLWAHDAKGRAAIARWLFWESSEWQPALVAILTTFVAQKLGLLSAGVAVSVDWSHERFVRLATFLDAHLQGRPFLDGDELSLADFSVAGMMMYVRDAGFPFDVFPHIGRWYRRIEELEAWGATAVAPWGS